MWGTSKTAVCATDAAGRISRFDGVVWSCAGPPVGWWGMALAGVGGSGADDVWVVGRSGAILHYKDAQP